MWCLRIRYSVVLAVTLCGTRAGQVEQKRGNIPADTPCAVQQWCGPRCPPAVMHWVQRMFCAGSEQSHQTPGFRQCLLQTDASAIHTDAFASHVYAALCSHCKSRGATAACSL